MFATSLGLTSQPRNAAAITPVSGSELHGRPALADVLIPGESSWLMLVARPASQRLCGAYVVPSTLPPEIRVPEGIFRT